MIIRLYVWRYDTYHISYDGISMICSWYADIICYICVLCTWNTSQNTVRYTDIILHVVILCGCRARSSTWYIYDTTTEELWVNRHQYDNMIPDIILYDMISVCVRSGKSKHQIRAYLKSMSAMLPALRLLLLYVPPRNTNLSGASPPLKPSIHPVVRAFLDVHLLHVISGLIEPCITFIGL